ncbi:MAG: SDR family oxidoreductase [Roseibium sp.]|nr:SDR family oxidoreductase [Roseibium sp.]
MKTVLVIGASRGIGKAVCNAAASAGLRVRAMSRSGSVPRRRDDLVEGFSGDALDLNDVSRALEGVDTVVQALGVDTSLNMVLRPVTLFSEATRILLPAMTEAGVGRLIAVTGFGAGDCASAINPLQKLPFRALLGRAYDDKTKQEQFIEASTLDWLLVRPGVLTNGRATGKYRVLEEPRSWRNGIISRADVAHYIAQQCSVSPLGRRKPVLIRCPI